MAIIDQLIASIEVRGAQQAERALKNVANAGTEVTTALTAMGAVGGALALVSHLQQIMEVLGSVSGVTIAAQFKSIEISLENLTGSASKAVRLMREFRTIGIASPFATVDVANVGMQALGAGVPDTELPRQLKSLMNVASFGNLSHSDLEPFMRNLLQIKDRGTSKPHGTDINQMFHRSPAIKALFAKQLGVDRAEANKQVRSMSGDDVYSLAIKAGEGVAKFAAETQALRNPLTVVSNMMEQLQMIMEPTGKLLIAFFTPVLYYLGKFAGFLGAVNEFSGGLVGLAAMAVVATYAIGRLTLSIAALAAIAGRGAGAGAAVGGAAIGVSGAMAAGVGVMRGLHPFLKALGLGAIIGLGGEAIGGKIQGDGSNRDNNVLGGFAKSMSMGAGIGAGVGLMTGNPLIIAVTTLLGAAIGGIYEGLKVLTNPQSYAGQSADETAKNTKRTAEAVEDLKTTVFGGGKRTRAAVSRYEAEYAFAKGLEFAL